MMRKLSPFIALLVCASLLPARQDRLGCGTHADKSREELHLHQQARRLQTAKLRNSAAVEKPAALHEDIGHIAILDDSDGILSRRNAFNLTRRTLKFQPSASGTRYAVQVAENTYVANPGVDLRLEDDDSREVSLPFLFPFFGQQYDKVWVNSDGNVTFGSGDAAVTDRSLGRFSAGSPRIAALFRDLDPTEARGSGVTTGMAGAAWEVTWDGVPEFRSSGFGPSQSFQLRLFPDGRIEVAFGSITTQSAVVGISAGNIEGQTNVVSLLNAPAGTEYERAVGERFTNIEELDIIAAAQRFYRNHEDSYDYLVFYNNQGIQADDGAVAYEVTLRNMRSGYGDDPVEAGTTAGSERRLQAIMNMGPLSQYPADPEGKVPARLSVGDTPVTTLAHEAGHLFLAFASIRDEDGERPMLNANRAHWNFLFNSEASLMEGNRIRDNGPNATPRFQTVGTVEGFSALDQYLMGLLPPQEVPDTFLVTNATGGTTSGLPRTGATFNGQRRNIRIDEIVAAEGRRTPDHTVSQRRFRFAFVLVTAEGEEPSTDDLAKLDGFRKRFEQYFSQATSNRASADTSLKRALDLSLWPAAGVVAGGSSNASVSIQTPAETPLTILLRAATGNARVPPSVTIPAGARQASFTWTGIRGGTDEITAEPADARFEAVQARVQVSAPEALQLVIVSGNDQSAVPGRPLAAPVRVRVTDTNLLPYAGVSVAATIAGGGQLDRSSAITDANGVAEFRWTPGPDIVNELRAQIPSGAAVTATALGRPLFSATSVVNAASFQPGLTPGGIATVFGANFRRSGTTVLLNGRSLPVLFADTRQLNFVVPENTQTGTAQLSVRSGNVISDAVQVPVTALQPGIFFDSATRYGAVLIAGTSQVTQVRAAARGETVEIYATGLGTVEQTRSGHRITLTQPEVLIGGIPAEVTFSGLAPGYTGLYQVNARVPNGTATGVVNLRVAAGSQRSNDVLIVVR